MKKHSLSAILSGNGDEEDQSKPSNHFVLTQILIPLGSLLIGAVGLWASSDKLPNEALWVIITYLVIVICYSLALPFKKIASFIRAGLTARRLARVFYPDLKRTARDLHSLLDGQHTNTILYILREMNSWEEFRENQIPIDSVHWNQTWLESVQQRLEENRSSAFRSIAKDLGLIISQHHYFCVRSQERLASTLNKVSLQEHHSRYLKEQWQIAREQHMRQAKNWEDLAKKINEAAVEHVCLDYYEPIKPF